MLTCSDNLYETLPNFLCCAETVFCLYVHPPELIVLTVLVFLFFFFFFPPRKERVHDRKQHCTPYYIRKISWGVPFEQGYKDGA